MEIVDSFGQRLNLLDQRHVATGAGPSVQRAASSNQHRRVTRSQAQQLADAKLIRKFGTDELAEDRRQAKEEEIRQVKLVDSIWLKRNYSRRLNQGLINSLVDEPLLATVVEEIIPKNN